MHKQRVIMGLVAILAMLVVPLYALAAPEATQAAPLGIHAEVMNPAGEYVVYVLKEGEWKEAGKLSFDKHFRSEEIDLSKYITGDGNVKIRLVEKGGGAAHIDAVLLGDRPPVEVKGIENALALKKLSKKDFDVVDAFEKSIELAFPTNGTSKVISLTARVEGTRISEIPFQFPLSNLFKELTRNSEFYHYSLNGGSGSEKRGRPDMSGNPFFKEYSVTGSGHPSGFTYGWVRNDDENLYVTIDFTPDDTEDGDKDYSKVYVKMDEGVKEFKVSVPETKWGRQDFTYTDKVEYQHKIYDFSIPLREIGVDMKKEKELLLAFAAYGTASPSPCPTNTCPNITTECTGGLTPVTYDASCTFACLPPSGSNFIKGTTPVTCQFDSSFCGFTVTVVDTTPPQVTCPANITVGSGDSCTTGEVVTYIASTSDACGLQSFSCTPPSGSTFPVGTTTVTCNSADTLGNTASCSFTVTVVGDTIPPTVTCPANITTETTSCSTGASVSYAVSASDSCGIQSLDCVPPGSTFPVGTTTVACTATDTSQNSATCTFGVTVNCLAPTCRSATFWGTHACPQTITPIDPNDAIGTITGENCEQQGDSCVQNITQAVINRCGACIDACGEDLTNTALGDENSAVEAVCVGPTGNIVLQLARQLAATALNCCISGSNGTCAGLSIEPIFTACNSVCDARKEAYASDSSFLKGPITATIGSDTFDCIKALDCFNNGGVPTPGFCATGTCSDNSALCAPKKLILCANPSTATCVPNTDNCYTRDLPLEDFGLTKCTGGDGSLQEGSTGSSNECYAAQNNYCAFLPAPFDPETTYDCGTKVKVKGVGNVLNQGKECCDTRVNCGNDD